MSIILLKSMKPAGWALAAGLTLTTIGLQVGTGGALTEQYYRQRGIRGYGLAQIEGLHQDTAAIAERTPAQSVAHIRAVLRTTVTELANLFEVSRQAVYGWLEGTQPTVTHGAKLADLAKAADVLVLEGVVGTSRDLRRKLPGGKTLFDSIRDGDSAEAGARVLVQMLRHETEQRRKLDARLGAREKRTLDYADAGAPMLDDRT
jgi:hypothetical protein